jgi:hypothetical protein
LSIEVTLLLQSNSEEIERISFVQQWIGSDTEEQQVIDHSCYPL